MSAEILEIEILKWEEFQHHNGSRTYDWFKFSSNFFIDHEMKVLSFQERLVFIYFLCQAAQSRSKVFKSSTKVTASDCKVYERFVKAAILKLCKFNIIRVLSGTIEVPQNRIEENRVEKNRREEKIKKEFPKDEKCNEKSQNEAKDIEPAGPSLPQLIWSSYSESYKRRYGGTEPVRNARVNSLVAQLAKRLGKEAPEVVKFYLSHNRAFYVQKAHDLSVCVADAEGLRTQWATGMKITKAGANSAEKLEHQIEQLRRIEKGEL